MTQIETIGRYEVVGRLAAGGMAEIFLARLRGPGGFRRPVVIKRVFPHLSEHAEFRAMFADEARIIAELRHVNVVHVHELGLEDGELYLVMEYLAGESLSGLLRRLAEEGRRIDPALACHVVAEVCAGLHAAHELTGKDGEPLHVVHRDVSPQNVFLTYEGDVKVIDFGIAKAADRLARTRTGHVKGKLGYMSPEQCRREMVDRTTDVFALGVVLHELVTGRRLFKGDNDLALARAICDEPIPKPSEVWGGCPASIDRIVMKALEREPVDRYASAAEMRTALLALARELDPSLEGRDALRTLMQRLFAERIAEKDAMVRATGAQPALSESDAAAVMQEATRAATPSTVAPVEPVARPARARWVLAMVAALALVAAGAWAFTRPEAGPGDRSSVAGDRESESALGDRSSALGDRESALGDRESGSALGDRESGSALGNRESGSEPESASGSESASESASGSEAESITLHVDTTPPGASVRVDGEPRSGTTPLVLELPRGEAAVEVELGRAGYRAERRTIVPTEDRRLSVELQRRRRRTPSAMDDEERGIDRDFFYFD